MRIYLSSTLNDLRAERQAVRDALSGLHLIVESYDATEDSVRQGCVADVASCELYIGIVGLRYGFIPPGESKSITELEFDAASEKRIPRLVFLKNPGKIYSTENDAHTKERDPAHIEAFRARLNSGAEAISKPAQFDDSADLKVFLLRGLLRLKNGQTADLFESDTGRAESAATHHAAPELPPGASVLQTMLADFLYQDWTLIERDRTFRKPAFVQGCGDPLTPAAVFCAVMAADCEDILLDLRDCFPAPAAAANKMRPDRTSPAFQALIHIALVAGEKYVQAKMVASGAFTGAAHDPIPASDLVLASVVAASVRRFGLRFKPEQQAPLSVLDLEPPSLEFGNTGEDTLAAVGKKEVLAKVNLLDMGRQTKLRSAGPVSDNLLKKLLDRIARLLGCSLTVSSVAAGTLAAPEQRIKLIESMETIGVPVFFRIAEHEKPPPVLAQILTDLEVFLDPIFSPESDN